MGNELLQCELTNELRTYREEIQIICYIEHEKGGAWQTVDYAIKQGKAVINLADEHKNKFKLFEKSEENH